VTDSQLFAGGLILLFLVDVFIAAMRAGLMNARYPRLLELRSEGNVRAGRTLELLNDMPRVNASLRITQSIVRFLFAGISLILYSPWENADSTLIWVWGILLIVAFVLWLSEFLIEQFVLRDPEGWAIRFTPYVRILVIGLSPLLALPLLLSRNGNNEEYHPNIMTEDEIRTLVTASQQEGVIEQEEQEMIQSIFEFGDTLAREIMVPRLDMLALEVAKPLSDAIDVLIESGYSRVPVFEETIDNIIGLLYTKDLLGIWHTGNRSGSLHDILRPAYFVPEAKMIDELLAEMQAQRIHLAIVIDEYGGVAGLVTLEDIIEEIFGEIHDEYDEGEESLYQIINENEVIFQGRTDLDDFNAIMNNNLSKEDADTLGGLIYCLIGRVPKGDESVQVDDLQLIVEQVIGKRIRKVRARRNPLSNNPKEGSNNAD
jgi:CBS domain containing-hemolysin-like protein